MRGRAVEPISEVEAAALFAALGGYSGLIIAVSGGPDSTALLFLAARWRAAIGASPDLIAVTVDHGLRKESALEACAVAKFSLALGVRHRTVRWTGRKPNTGIQAAAREARYRLLAEAAHKANAPAILTAHTLDDQAETILFRMARGSGVTGLAGMAPAAPVPVVSGFGITLVRPLLSVPKARLIATLDAAKIAYALDPSNNDPRFARPRLRAALPVLAGEGLTAERLGRLAGRVRRIEDAVATAVDAAQAVLCPGPWGRSGPVSVNAGSFLGEPSEIGIRLLARLVAAVGGEGAPELAQLEALYDEILAVGGPNRPKTAGDRLRCTLGGALITLSKGTLTVELAPPRRPGAKTGGTDRKRAFTALRSR